MASKQELQELNLEELRDRARDKEVPGLSGMKKDELVEALVKEQRKESQRRSRQSGSKPSGSKQSKQGGGKRGDSKRGGGKQSKGSQQSHQSDGASGAVKVARQARRQLAELIDKPIEGVLTLEPTDDGWRVVIEVSELRRIPDSTDVLASYEIELDSDGELLSYRRTSRYLRAQADSSR